MKTFGEYTAMDCKCRYCGYIFTAHNGHLAWLQGSYIKGGCPRCGHRLTADDVIATTTPSDSERQASARARDGATR